MLQTHKLTQEFDGRTVLDEVSLSIQAGDKIGLVGTNGSGKSTLLKILAGLDTPEYGQLTIDPQITIGYIPQAPDYARSKQTVGDILSDFVEPREDYRIDITLGLLDLTEQKDKVLCNLSSGQRTRVYLARIALQECDLLLLDEPTNHLDIEGLQWLEDYLSNFEGVILTVSHDRAFLDKLTQRTIELRDGKISEYGGNYSFYKSQKEIEQQAQVKAYESQQKEISRLKKSLKETKAEAVRTHDDRRQTRDNDKYAVDFFAERASQNKSSASKVMEKRLENMEKVNKPKLDPNLEMFFGSQSLGSQIVAKLEKVGYAINDVQILQETSLVIQRGSRIHLRGLNGSGKTTLIKLLLGELEPSSGDIAIGPSTKIGYLSQEHEILQSSTRVLQELTEETEINPTLAYQLLVWLNLPTDKIQQPVNTLSKGEQSKILLAKIIAGRANLLILDEPTNHLDILTRDSLESALQAYKGTLLVISHDRYFVEEIKLDQRWEMDAGKLTFLH
jgi:ATPase subunit of ABC transporter with duplicated ATPase domains